MSIGGPPIATATQPDYDSAVLVIPKSYAPAAVGGAETPALVRLLKGWRVLWVAVQKEIQCSGGSTPTITIGDSASANGYVTAGDLSLQTGAVGDLVSGSGTFLANSGGKLYSTLDSLIATYTPGGTPGTIIPRIRLKVAIMREWNFR